MKAAALHDKRITPDKHENTNSYHIGCMKKPGCYSKKNVVSNKMIVNPPNKSEQLIRNVELVRPKTVQLTITNVLIVTRKDNFLEQLFANVVTSNIWPVVQRVKVTQQIPQIANQTQDTESTPIQDKNTLRQYWELSRLVTKIRHVRQKEITVCNIHLYVAEPNVENSLSCKVCEELSKS